MSCELSAMSSLCLRFAVDTSSAGKPVIVSAYGSHARCPRPAPRSRERTRTGNRGAPEEMAVQDGSRPGAIRGDRASPAQGDEDLDPPLPARKLRAKYSERAGHLLGR